MPWIIFDAYQKNPLFGRPNETPTSFELNESVRKTTELNLAWLRRPPNTQACLAEDLMLVAVDAPKTFAKMISAAFLTPPKNWRAPVATHHLRAALLLNGREIVGMDQE